MGVSKYFKLENYKIKLRERKYTRQYDEQAAIVGEKAKFKRASINYAEGEQLLKDVAQKHGFSDFIEKKGMSNSVHWHLFACLAIKGGIDRILEIGTYDGVTVNFLSKLFPEAQIDTFDLPATDPILASSYKREDDAAMKQFLSKQESNTSSDNINLVLENSFFIPDTIKNNSYDLVWIDGGHKYPDIAWDICNGYHAAKKGGWIMVDDVMARKDAYETPNVNANSFETLKYLEERVKSDFYYFLKRTDTKFSANPYKKKFVGLFQKPTT